MVEPVVASLLQLQLGLRLIRQAAKIASASADVKQRGDIVEALITFPTARSSILLRQTDFASQLQARSDISGLASRCFHDVRGVRPCRARDQGARKPRHAAQHQPQLRADLPAVGARQGEAKREEEESVSLYKSRKIEESIEMDAEAEEKEFRACSRSTTTMFWMVHVPSLRETGRRRQSSRACILPTASVCNHSECTRRDLRPPSHKTSTNLYQQERDNLVTS